MRPTSLSTVTTDLIVTKEEDALSPMLRLHTWISDFLIIPNRVLEIKTLLKMLLMDVVR